MWLEARATVVLEPVISIMNLTVRWEPRDLIRNGYQWSKLAALMPALATHTENGRR